MHCICNHKKFSLTFLALIATLMMSPVLLTAQEIPAVLKDFIHSVEVSRIGHIKASFKFQKVEPGIFKVDIKWQLPENIKQDDAAVNILPAFKPTFHWAPHLTPTGRHIIAQHVFRSPAIIVSNDKYSFRLVPDLDQFKQGYPPVYMDMDAPENKLTIGFSKAKVDKHVLFLRDTGLIFNRGDLSLSFYLLVEKNDTARLNNPFRSVVSFLWKKWGTKLYRQGEPLPDKDLDVFVKATYDWAFNHWKKTVWQEFTLNNQKVGAPVFIVNVTQSPNYPGEVNERETRSVWNQAWFSSLRSASGLYRFARRTKNSAYKNYALLTKELALSFPQTNGFFPSVIMTEMFDTIIKGQDYRRSRGWGTKRFGNSNRNPFTWKLEESPYHVLDMSFTALQMLNWYRDLEKDERLLNYAINYADALIKIQQDDGFFPAWLSGVSFHQLPTLSRSPETSLTVTFLLRLYQITSEKKYLIAAVNAVEAVDEHVVNTGRWEDFETYWSCSRFGSDTLVGKKIFRNNQFKQNTLSIYYTAQAYLEMYKATRDTKHLWRGQRVLDELLMYQASWQPPFMAIRTLGGFGVMNADAEWNDSRQSLFAPLILEYGKLLNDDSYRERGRAALKASFTMIYHPLNQSTLQQWERRYPFFGKTDYGFMMENYGHDGTTNNEGLGIGEFTIYDWGNGAAAEAYNYMLDAGLYD